MPLGKGRTNNPNGRPRKNQSLTELLAKYGNKKIVISADDPKYEDYKELNGMKVRDALTKRLVQLAVFEKDLAAIKYIYDRIDGKPAITLKTNPGTGGVEVIKAVQKDLFSEDELGGIQDEGTLEPPAETGAGAGVQRV